MRHSSQRPLPQGDFLFALQAFQVELVLEGSEIPGHFKQFGNA
jgi:hypothetical protein